MRNKPILSGLASMIVGSAVVFSTVVMINRFAAGPETEKVARQATIDHQKKENKPKPKKVVENKEPPKPKRLRQAPKPLVGLDSSLAGLDLGIPAFDVEDLGNLSSDLLGSARDVVMTDDSVDDPPRPLQQSPMQYPPRARAKGIEGYVLLSLLISPTGNVERIKVLEAQPSNMFEDVAIAGVKSWKFEPATYKGESVRVWARQKVTFDLS